jgi:hypothetical protein
MNGAAGPVLLALLMAIPWRALARDVGGASTNMTYREVKTWHQEFLASIPSGAERTNAIRDVLRSSRTGERGLQRVYKNFDGRWWIDPRVPGVEQSALLQRSVDAASASRLLFERLVGREEGRWPLRRRKGPARC